MRTHWLENGSGTGPRNRIDSGREERMLGSKSIGGHAAGVTWGTAAAQNVHVQEVWCFVRKGVGGLALRRPLHSVHFVFTEFVCLFERVYQVD